MYLESKMTYAQYLAAKLAAEKEENLEKVTLSKGKRRIPYAKSFATLYGGAAGLLPGAMIGSGIGGAVSGNSIAGSTAGGMVGGALGAVIAGIIARKAIKEHYDAVSPYDVV